jgi:hypothetical protein
LGNAAGGSPRRAEQQLADKVLFTVDANSDVLSSRISEAGNGKGPTDGHFQKQKLPIIEAKNLDKISVRMGCGCGAGGRQDEEPEEGGGAEGGGETVGPRGESAGGVEYILPNKSVSCIVPGALYTMLHR